MYYSGPSTTPSSTLREASRTDYSVSAYDRHKKIYTFGNFLKKCFDQCQRATLGGQQPEHTHTSSLALPSSESNLLRAGQPSLPFVS